MIDNVSLSIAIGEQISPPNISGEKIVFANIELVGCPNPKDLNTYTYKGRERNLLFSLTNQTLRINNSLHKFARGDNYSDFSFCQLKEAIQCIENLTQKDANEIKLHTCELAMNITTELPGKEYLDKFSTYNYKEFDKMKNGSSTYGIKCILSEYSIKIYDKREHYKLQYNKDIGLDMLRFEIKYIKARRLKGLKHLGDFKNTDKIRLAFLDYFSILTRIRCVLAMDLRNLKSQEMSLYFAGQHAKYWKEEKKRDKEAVKYKRKLFQEIILKTNQTDLMPLFIESLKLKFEALLNS